MAEARKIAAILAADFVGFSRMANADEDRTLARLRILRAELIDPTVASQNGRVFKRTGDGVLVEFRSVVEAVRCAITVQNAMVERNAGLPADQRIEFRIGIHLGDVVEESDGDLMGEGVNIAARLEGIAKPGAICLSDDAYRQVKGRLDLAVTDLGATQLKNIAEPVRVYSLQVGVPAQTKPAKAAKPALKARAPLALAVTLVALLVVAAGAWRWRSEERPALAEAAAVAVLPFDNLGGDAEASRLADGMTEDIITDLGRFKELLVIARNSVSQYKGKTVDARQIAKDLNVSFVVAGSVQHQVDQLRVTATLIDSSGAQVWSERWDRPAGDLFAIQAELANKVAATLAGETDLRLGAIPARLLAEAKKRAPANLTAYDLTLLARDQRLLVTKESNQKGLEYVEKAIALDPTLASAYVTRGWLNFTKFMLFGLPHETQIKKLESDTLFALSLDPASAEAHAALIYFFADQGKWAELSAEIERAVSIHPTNASVLTQAAAQLAYLGRPEDAAAMADRVLRLDPQLPLSRRGMLTTAYFLSRNFGKVLEVSDPIPDDALWPLTQILRAMHLTVESRKRSAKRRTSSRSTVNRLWRFSTTRVRYLPASKKRTSTARRSANSAFASAPPRRS
jgi:adenylate cyclase